MLNLFQTNLRAVVPVLGALALLSAGTVQAEVPCPGCVGLINLPTSVAYTQITETQQPLFTSASGGAGFFTVTLTNPPSGTSLSAATYAAWCGSWASSFTNLTGGPQLYSVYSTYGAVPAGYAPLPSGNTFNMVNYILNHKRGTLYEVQNAIWLIMTGQDDQPATQPTLDMVSEAKLNPGYYPPALGTMAVFYAVGPVLPPDEGTASDLPQSILLEIPVPSIVDDSSRLKLVCPAAETGQVGTPFSSGLQITGGFPPYVVSLSSGALPTGLTLNTSTGTITGTPTVGGAFTFTAKVVNDLQGSATTTKVGGCTITIPQPPPPPLVLSCPVYPAGVAGMPYTGPALITSGGSGGNTFTLNVGSSLPSALTLNPSTGIVSGIPAAASSTSFMPVVTDSLGVTATPAVPCGITVSGPPTIQACPNITATQGVAITPVTLVGTGGAGGSYVFSAPSLPAGLTLSAAGVLSGTPTVSDMLSYSFRITDMGSGAFATVTCSITIAPPVVTSIPVGVGDTATIGFWNNKNGQYIISILKPASPSSPTIAQWLILKGGALYPTLTASSTNAAVATLFQTLFKATGTKTRAQIMAASLASYFTSVALSGNDSLTVAARTKFHFNVSTTGTGSKVYNVGSYGTAIGLVNYTSYTVDQLLAQAKMKISAPPPSTFDATAFNVIFDGINQKGDIK